MRNIGHRVAMAWRTLRTSEPAASSERGGVDDLSRRVAHLEAALEGLQDAVYRQDIVHDRQIADLRERHPRPGARSPAHWGQSS
jgi:hypothetical protein